MILLWLNLNGSLITKGDMLKKMAENGVDTTGLVNAPLSTIQDNYSKTSGGANIIKINDNDAKLQSIEKLLSPEMVKTTCFICWCR